MTRSEREHINNRVVVEFAKTVELFGVIPSEARLFTVLYLQGEPMTLDQMSEALGKSKTSVSNGIRNLLDLNVVEKVWKKGERKDLYKTAENLYKTFMTAYVSRWLDTTNRQTQVLIELEKELNEKIRPFKNEKEQNDAAIYTNKLKEMIAFQQAIIQTFQIIKSTSYFANNEKE